MSDNGDVIVLGYEDLFDAVSELGRTEQDVAARTYTKTEGFKNLTILQASPPHVLGSMAACIFTALAEQASDEIPGAAEQADILIEFAKDITGRTAELRAERERFAKFDDQIASLASAAHAIGFVDSDPADMSTEERLTMVRRFIEKQGIEASKSDLVQFLDAQIESFASAE